MLQTILAHIDYLEASVRELDAHLVAGLDSPAEKNALALLQTVPGIDVIGRRCCWSRSAPGYALRANPPYDHCRATGIHDGFRVVMTHAPPKAMSPAQTI